MKIYGLSDIHGNLSYEIPQCDVICIGGDIIGINEQSDDDLSEKWWKEDFVEWANKQPCDKVFLTPGNHDKYIARLNDEPVTGGIERFKCEISDLTKNKVEILINNLVTYKDLNFYGCPYVKPIFGQENKWGFQSEDKDDFKIPYETDILITHDNPYVNTMLETNGKNIKAHIYGHWHEGEDCPDAGRYNCSVIDNCYNYTKNPRLIIIKEADMDLSIPYYDDKTRINNSSLGYYLEKGPQYLKAMLDGTEEGLNGSFLEKGTMIHKYILEPDDFWNDYEILDFEAPKSKNQKEFCEHYANSTELIPDEQKLTAYRKAYSNKKSESVILKECDEIIETYADYIKYLKIGTTKKVISFADVNMLKNIKDNLENHKAASKILYDYEKTFECHNEFHINWEVKKKNEKVDINVKCKSLLDRLMIDHERKIINLVDLKSTADVHNFYKSVDKYDYQRQLAFYTCALTWYFTNILKIDIEDYEFHAYIIAIQSNGNNEVRVYEMLDESIVNRKVNKIETVLSDISYHINTGNWEHTLDYYNGNGVEQLRSCC